MIKSSISNGGQVFEIEGKHFFTFRGAASHDIQGGVFDVDDPDFVKKCIAASNSKLPYRIKNITWWEQELPTKEELDEGFINLKKVDYKVDYIISHCLSSAMQDKLETLYGESSFQKLYESDILTDYFDLIEEYVDYKKWYCGHYHMNLVLDKKHKIFYDLIMPLDE